MRGAWTSENDKVTLFSGMLHDEAVTIAQVRVPDDTNEITQPVPPGRGEIRKRIGPGHPRRRAHPAETAVAIGGKSGWDYLMTIKGNQPSLQREVFAKILPLLSSPAPRHEEHSRGRIKRWSCYH